MALSAVTNELLCLSDTLEGQWHLALGHIMNHKDVAGVL